MNRFFVITRYVGVFLATVFCAAVFLWVILSTFTPMIAEAQSVNCYGNGTTCRTALQQLPNVTGDGYLLETFMAGGQRYLIMDAGTVRTYRWSASQECFGNGTTCGVALQTLALPSSRLPLVSQIISAGTDVFLLTGARGGGGNDYTFYNYKWMPASSCFGNGSVCGTALSSYLSSLPGEPQSIASLSTGSDRFVVISYYVASGGGTSQNALYKWMPVSSCFGNGSVCGSHTQAISSGSHSRSGGLRSYTLGGQIYLIISEYAKLLTHVLKWQPTQQCFGNGTTCGVDMQTLTFASIKQISDWEVFTTGGETYLLGGANTGQSPLYIWMSTSSCWGNGVSCGVAFTGANIPSRDWSLFTYVTDTFALGAGASVAPEVHKWMPASKCFGNGTNCAREVQLLADLFLTSTTFSDNEKNYAVLNKSAFKLYEWQPIQPTCSVNISPTTINGGSSATLTWTSTNAISLYIQNVGYVNATGSTTVMPSQTTSYSGTASWVGSPISCTGTQTITVQQSCPWNAGTVTHGQSVTAYQNSSVPFGSSCSAQTRTCSNGTLSGSYQYPTCTVQVVPPPPTVIISVTPTIVQRGETTTVTWSSSGATACTVTGGGSSWSGIASPPGGQTSAPILGEVIFTARCQNAGGESTATATVKILPVFQEV